MTEKGQIYEEGVQRFLETLRQNVTDADCDRCLSQLSDFVDAQLAGEPVETRFAWLMQHLDRCVECAEAYSLIYESVLAEGNGRLPTPTTIPEPNLDFLQPVKPDLAGLLQNALVQTAVSLTLQLNEAILGLLAPLPSAVTRAGEDGRFSERILELTEQRVADVPIKLVAYRDQQQPTLCLLEVTVEPAGESWPDLGGRQVTVTMGEKVETSAVSRVEVAVTDDFGLAVFNDIQIEQLNTLKINVKL